MILDSNMLTSLANPTIQPVWFLWIKARNRISGVYEESGVWSGIEPFTLVVDGQTRTYAGAGGLLNISAINYEAGTNIQTQSVSVTILDPQIYTAIRTYEPKYAPVQIHLGLIDPATEGLVGVTKAFDGFIDSIDETEDFETSECTLSLVSSMRNGSRPLYAKQTNEYQRSRNPNDSGRAYASIAGNVSVFWGRKSEHAGAQSRGRGDGGLNPRGIFGIR